MRTLYKVLAYLVAAEVVVQAMAMVYAIAGLGKWVDGGGLVLGWIAFAPSTTVTILGLVVLSVWLVVVGRENGLLAPRIARLGRVTGVAMLVGAGTAGVALALPWQSVAQVAVFAVTVLPGLIGFSCLPVWWLLVGRDLAAPMQAPTTGLTR